MAEEEEMQAPELPSQGQQPAESAEAEVSEEEDERLPFPNARVVNIIRSSLTQPHQIKRDVKLGANHLLGEILKDISQSMNVEQYHTLSIEHFNKASRKYREIALNQKRIRRIKAVLEKQRAELDEIITEIELEMPGGQVQG